MIARGQAGPETNGILLGMTIIDDGGPLRGQGCGRFLLAGTNLHYSIGTARLLTLELRGHALTSADTNLPLIQNLGIGAVFAASNVCDAAEGIPYVPPVIIDPMIPLRPIPLFHVSTGDLAVDADQIHDLLSFLKTLE